MAKSKKLTFEEIEDKAFDISCAFEDFKRYDNYADEISKKGQIAICYEYDSSYYKLCKADEELKRLIIDYFKNKVIQKQEELKTLIDK